MIIVITAGFVLAVVGGMAVAVLISMDRVAGLADSHPAMTGARRH